MNKESPIIAKFLSKIIRDNSSDCWHLRSDRNNQYKPFFYYQGKKYTARKFSYMYFKGDINSNYKVYTSCGNSLCINPDHFYLGSPGENMRILIKSGWKKTGFKHSDEAIEKISKFHKGKTISNSTRQKLKLANLGKKVPQEVIQKIINTKKQKGIKLSQEAKDKIALTKQGEKNYNAILKVSDIMRIRTLAENLTQADIAELYKISGSHISNIINKKVWKHV